jgi:hypothetical protein
MTSYKPVTAFVSGLVAGAAAFAFHEILTVLASSGV